jgi:hypothetical protein
MASGPGGLTRRVYPSGFARATCAAPIFEPAPGTLSTTTCLPHPLLLQPFSEQSGQHIGGGAASGGHHDPHIPVGKVLPCGRAAAEHENEQSPTHSSAIHPFLHCVRALFSDALVTHCAGRTISRAASVKFGHPRAAKAAFRSRGFAEHPFRKKIPTFRDHARFTASASKPAGWSP